MNYKFDGYDAILNDSDELIYDDIDDRAADIIIRQMVSLDLCEARIAELEAALCQETAIQETEKDKHIVYLEAMVAYYRGIEPHAKNRIAELDGEIDALKRECNPLYASLSQPGKYRLPPKSVGVGQFVATLRYEVPEWWGMEELAAEYANRPERFKQLAFELLREDAQEVLDGATWKIEAQPAASSTNLEKKAQSYDDLLSVVYGQNLMVYGWHQNGEPEPLDNFIDNNRQ